MSNVKLIMIKPSPYHSILVESFRPESTSGRHGPIHIRPMAGQLLFPQHLFVQCSRSLVEDYDPGTKFRICGKLSVMKGKPYIYSRYSWQFEVVK